MGTSKCASSARPNPPDRTSSHIFRIAMQCSATHLTRPSTRPSTHTTCNTTGTTNGRGWSLREVATFHARWQTPKTGAGNGGGGCFEKPGKSSDAGKSSESQEDMGNALPGTSMQPLMQESHTAADSRRRRRQTRKPAGQQTRGT